MELERDNQAQPQTAPGRPCALLLIGTFALLVLAGAAGAARIVASGLVVVAEGGFKPTALPEKHNAPITLRAEGRISTTSGAQPPLLREIELELDRHDSLATTGLAGAPRRKS